MAFILISVAACGVLTACKKQEAYDPLDNAFASGREDWAAAKGTKLTVNDKFLTVRGKNASASKTWTLPDLSNLWVDFDYKPDGAAVALKVDISVDGKSVTAADALPVHADFGILNYQIPFPMWFGDGYRGKEAVLTLAVIGGTAQSGISISRVKTYGRTIAGTPDTVNNPLVNTFANSLEDWYIGGHYSSADYGYQLRGSVEPFYGRVKIDGSQLWTRQFTPNINTSMSKYFALPQDSESVQYKMNLTVNASDRGTFIMVLFITDGKVTEVTDGWFYSHSKEKMTLSCAVQLGGKRAQVILMQRDSNLNAGHSEFVFVERFEVVPYNVNPAHNAFIIDLEDWTDNGAGTEKEIKVEGGYAVLPGGASMTKTFTFPVLSDSWRQSVRMYFMTEGKINIKLEMTVDGVTKAIYSREDDNRRPGETGMHEYLFDSPAVIPSDMFYFTFGESLGGKTATFTLTASGASAGAVMKLGIFRITQKWEVNPYDNRFYDDIEDWYNISSQGWFSNSITYDPSWTRIQIDYGPSGLGDTILGQTVFGKTYRLFDSPYIQLYFTLEGTNKTRDGFVGSFTLDMIIDGTEYNVLPKQGVPYGLPVTPYTILLDKVDSLNGIDYADKTVELRFTFDEDPDGIEMLAWMAIFTTTIYK